MSLIPEPLLQAGLIIALCCWVCLGALGQRVHAGLLCVWPQHVLFLRCYWDIGLKFGTAGCPVAEAELSKLSMHTWFNYKCRTGIRIWSQATSGYGGLTCFHPVHFNYTASLFLSGLPHGRSVRLCFFSSADKVGQALHGFLACLIFCPFFFVLRLQMEVLELNREKFKASVPCPSCFLWGSPPSLACGVAMRTDEVFLFTLQHLVKFLS